MRGVHALLFIAVVVSAYPALGRDGDVVRLTIDADDAGTKIDLRARGRRVTAMTEKSGRRTGERDIGKHAT